MSEIFAELSLGEEKFKFNTIDDIEKWALSEKDAWAWCLQTSPGRKVVQALAQTNNRLDSILTQIKNAAKDELPDDAKQKALMQIQRLLRQLETQGIPFSSKSPIGLYVLEIAKNNIDLALAIVKARVDPNVDIQAGAKLELVQNQWLDQDVENNQKRIVKEINELNSQRSEFQNFREKCGGEFADDRTQNQAKFEELIEKKTVEFNAQIAALNVKVADSQKALEHLTETYESHMQLDGSVSYWKKKKVRHGWIALVFAVLFLLVGGGMAGTVYYLIANLILPNYAAALESDKEFNGLALWTPTSILLITVALFAWPLRLLSKNLLSNIHLCEDCGHRETVLTTYLAMFKEGQLEEPTGSWFSTLSSGRYQLAW